MIVSCVSAVGCERLKRNTCFYARVGRKVNGDLRVEVNCVWTKSQPGNQTGQFIVTHMSMATGPKDRGIRWEVFN